MHLGSFDKAQDRARLSLTLAQDIDAEWEKARSLLMLGNTSLALGSYTEAQQWLAESVSGYREIGNRAELAWALACLSYAARSLGQRHDARRQLSEALGLAVEIGVFIPLPYVLPAVALLLTDQGDVERAVELYALASRYPHVANSRWFEAVAGKEIAAVAAALPPDVVAAAQERGRARDLWKTAEELLEELTEK
jgi:tetratricopeptide (TPR) repeat protein